MIEKYLITLSALLSTAVISHADTGVFESFIGLNVNGGGNVWYGAQQVGPNVLAAFNGLSIGTFNPSTQSLLLSGGELETFKNNGANNAISGNNVNGAVINYEINKVGNAVGPFTPLNLGFTSDIQFNDAASNPFNTPGDQKWAQIPSTPNILAGLAPGNYQLDIYFNSTTDNSGTTTQPQYSNNGGANFIATFTVVPEPTTLALAGLGGLSLMLFRRQRK